MASFDRLLFVTPGGDAKSGIALERQIDRVADVAYGYLPSDERGYIQDGKICILGGVAMRAEESARLKNSIVERLEKEYKIAARAIVFSGRRVDSFAGELRRHESFFNDKKVARNGVGLVTDGILMPTAMRALEKRNIKSTEFEVRPPSFRRVVDLPLSVLSSPAGPEVGEDRHDLKLVGDF